MTPAVTPAGAEEEEEAPAPGASVGIDALVGGVAEDEDAPPHRIVVARGEKRDTLLLLPPLLPTAAEAEEGIGAGEAEEEEAPPCMSA